MGPRLLTRPPPHLARDATPPCAGTLIGTLMESHHARHAAHSESGASGWFAWFGFPRIRYAVPTPTSSARSALGSGLLFAAEPLREPLVE